MVVTSYGRIKNPDGKIKKNQENANNSPSYYCAAIIKTNLKNNQDFFNFFKRTKPDLTKLKVLRLCWKYNTCQDEENTEIWYETETKRLLLNV